MSTEAQLKAISNSELASGNQIPALKHRTVNNAIIEEMYDAQSRGDVLAGVQTAVSIASGDQVLVIRSGQAYLLDSSEFGFVDALADLTDVSIPTPANDQVLAYNTATSKWVAKDVNTLTSVVSISGTATTNALTKFTGTSSIGNSIISDNGTTVTIAGDLSVNNNLTVGTINSGTSSDFVKGDGSLDSTTYQDTSEKGQANGYAPLDSGAKVAEAYLPDSILGQVSYQGTWAASTNTPTLANPPASTTKGEYYVSSDDGTQFGIEFVTGDWIISNGSAWEKVDNTDTVTSVFGRIGPVVANAGDYDQYYVNLDGDQIITGEKTFSGDSLLIADAGNGLKGRFKNTSINSAQDSGYATFGFNGSNNLFFTKATSANFNGGVFAWDNDNAIRTYTLQDASGTLAFTSDLDDYVTLDTFQEISSIKNFNGGLNSLRVQIQSAGSTNSQTRIANIVGNFLSATGTNGIGFNEDNNIYFTKDNNFGGKGGVLAWNNTGNRTYTLPDASGTLAFTSDINDTLDSVTDRGNTTTNAITVGGATISGNLTVDTDTLYVDSVNDRVGIKRTPTNDELEIQASNYRGLTLKSDTTAHRPTLTFLNSADGAAYIQSSGDALIFGRVNTDYGGHTERMRIDSSGNVGIGTSSPTTITNYRSLTLDGTTGSILDLRGGGTLGARIVGTASGMSLETGGATLMNFYTSGTERMRIDSSGNVGIGGSADQYSIGFSKFITLTDSTASGYTVIEAAGGSGGGGGIHLGNQTVRQAGIFSLDGSDLAFYTNSTNSGSGLTERMRIASNGNVFMPYLAGSSGYNDLAYNTANGQLIYRTSSIRYKENVKDLPSTLDKVTSLRTITYDEKETGRSYFGLIAEELYEHIPELVTMKKVEGFDEPQPDGITYSMLSVHLLKAIQEQQEIINDMRAEIETLKQQING